VPEPRISAECQKLLDTVRKRCPGLLPGDPVSPGTVVDDVALKPAGAAALFPAAAVLAAGVDQPGADPNAAVLWREGDLELLVQPAGVTARFATGVVVVKLLRAAIQARGVWEVDLNGPGTARTYVRVHQWDTRRPVTTGLTDPTQAVPNTALSWHASPDVRVRPRRGSKPRNPVGLPWTGASPDAYGLWVFQTALHGRTVAGSQDQLVKPDGQWTALFDTRLRAANGASNRITLALWRSIVGNGASFPNAYADPWAGATPTEADLAELIVDLPPAGASPVSMGIRPVAARVDVLVHHRHLKTEPAANVKVTLLRREVTGTAPAAWAALAGTWAAPVQTFLHNGGAAPALPADWTFADTATPVRSPPADVDARLPRAVTFDTDFTGQATGKRFLLVAVVHSVIDPAVLPGSALQALVLGTRFAAVRSVEIV
jgi:hypothetical protein